VEGLASAGGIAISGTVYEHIKEKLSLGYHYLGEQEVKNISEPVRIYRLLTEPEDAGKMIGEEKPKSRKSRFVAFGAFGLIILIAGALLIWNNYFRAKIEPASVQKMTYTQSEKPSIAVLPFENMSGDPEQEYFSDGIAVEIINALTRWPTIVIIPRSSSFIYKGKNVDITKVGREMGVRYVLEGSVRREENRVRVTVQLVDVTTLKHIFSERYEREMKDIFAIQDEITMGVLTAMRVSLSGTGVPSLRGKPTKSIEAYLKLLQAEDIFLSMNRDTQARAKRLAEEAIALDSEYARAYALMAATIGNEVLLGVYDNPQEALEQAIELSEKAIQLDESENMAHRVRGFLALLNKDYETAIAGGRRALELAPNSVMAQMVLGYFLYSAGRTEEAIPILEKAVAANPIPSPRALSHLGIAYRKVRRYEEAVVVCRKLIKIKPNYIYPHLTLAATFAETDNMEEARAEISEVLRINPKYTVKLVPRSFPWKDQAELDRLADSLHKAGLPD
jgi:adenylate cyclase